MSETVFKRREVKYLLEAGQRERLEHLADTLMVPDAYGPSTVSNLYFDTPTLLLARRSADHPRYKEKVRLRTYDTGVSSPVFLEVKKKFDGIVYKRRAELTSDEAWALALGYGDPRTQIERELDFTIRRYDGLSPVVYLAYDRQAHLSPTDPNFRLTLDTNVRARTDRLSLSGATDGERILEDGLTIVEVKSKDSMPLWLARFLSAEHLFKTSWSKYGHACYLLGRRFSCAIPVGQTKE